MDRGGAVKTYTVRAEWDATGWWVVTVPDIAGAITQSKRLDRVADDVAEVIELMTGEAPGTYEIDLDWSVPVEAGQHAAEARELRAKADAVAQEATEATNRAVRELAAAGFTYRDIGTMTGVSYQRAQQIVPSKTRTRRAKLRRRVPA
jgi:predicted RNase H-like HicB family nuclease